MDISQEILDVEKFGPNGVGIVICAKVHLLDEQGRQRPARLAASRTSACAARTGPSFGRPGG